MLRCPPSRINLTSSDVAGLEQRLAARHSARFSKHKSSSVRLIRGPQHPTIFSVVSAEDNAAQRRAGSTSSQATFCNVSNDQVVAGGPPDFVSNDSRASGVASPAAVHEPPRDRSALSDEAARALNNVVMQMKSPAKSTAPSSQIDPSRNADLDGSARYGEHTPQPQTTGYLDGALERPRDSSFIYATPSMPFTRRGNRLLGEIQQDACPLTDCRTTDPQTNRRLLSSARARRRHARSHDIRFHEDPDEWEEFRYADYNQHSVPRGRGAAVEPFHHPQSIVPGETIHGFQSADLDPGAPAFVPRTRFGSTTQPFVDNGSAMLPYWGSLDSTHNASHLRIRSTSEQNTEVRLPRRDSGREPTDALTDVLPEEGWVARHLYRSRYVDQNAAFMEPMSNLERYPPLRPPSSIDTHRRSSSFLRRFSGEPQDNAGSHSTTLHSCHDDSASAHPQRYLHVPPTLIVGNSNASDLALRTRSASPAVSTTSRSTPNLISMSVAAPHIGSRISSRSWMHSQSPWSASQRISSMVSAASAVSRDDFPVRSTRTERDAAEEFIRRRNSPLDELTERFSRMRSVGRSWERAPGSRPRPSLLNGDPFGQFPAPNTTQVESNTTVPEYALPLENLTRLEEEEEEDSSDADLVALSLALPPSSPLPSSVQLPPSTPPLPGTYPTSPRSPLAQRSPAKSYASPESCVKRKPLPQATTTPKINVYDDRQPQNTQPQTPADLTRSRRMNTQSSTAAPQSPIHVGRAIVESPPVIPERHIHRCTYQPASTSQAGAHAAIANSVTPGFAGASDVSQHSRRPRGRPRPQSQRSSEQVENDLEGHLPGLEEDRRTWLNRHEAGSLDTTPPREGRFERFLS